MKQIWPRIVSRIILNHHYDSNWIWLWLIIHAFVFPWKLEWSSFYVGTHIELFFKITILKNTAKCQGSIRLDQCFCNFLKKALPRRYVASDLLKLWSQLILKTTFKDSFRQFNKSQSVLICIQDSFNSLPCLWNKI